MTTTKNNEHNKLNFSSEREQSQTCLNSAEHEKNQGRKVLNVPNLRFPEFQGEWEKCKLGDYGKVVTGNTPPTKDIENYENGTYLWASPADLGTIKLISETKTMLSAKGFSKTRALPKGSVLVTCIGSTIGKTGMATKEMSTNQQINSIVVNENSDNEFVYYSIQSAFPRYLSSIAVQAVPIISKSAFELLPNQRPCLQEQKKIGKMLSLLDERIATQNKIIEDLKKLKSAIIEIEYTPNTKTTSHIGNVIEQISKRNKNNAIQNVLSVSNRQGFIKQSDQFENRNVASEDTSNYKIVEKNDFAFNPARINVGSIARLTTFEKGIVSPMYICFRTQENVAPEYIDFFFESKHFYCEIQKRLEGSVRQCLSFEGLCNIPFSLPSLEMQQRIGKRLFILGQKIKTETDLLELLNKQKQYLLRQMFI